MQPAARAHRAWGWPLASLLALGAAALLADTPALLQGPAVDPLPAGRACTPGAAATPLAAMV